MSTAILLADLHGTDQEGPLAQIEPLAKAAKCFGHPQIGWTLHFHDKLLPVFQSALHHSAAVTPIRSLLCSANTAQASYPHAAPSATSTLMYHMKAVLDRSRDTVLSSVSLFS